MELNALNSRLARRIFLTFIACALAPVAILSVLSLFQVNRQLETQAWQRLHRAAKSYGLSIYERLMFCEDELKQIDLHSSRDIVRQREKFSAIGRRFADGRYEAVLGDPIPDVRLTGPQKTHLENGNTLLVIGAGDPPGIILVRYCYAGRTFHGMLVGTVRSDYLWGLGRGNSLPALCESAIVTARQRALYLSVEGIPRFPDIEKGAPGKHVRMRMADTDWFVVNWSLFLKPKFGTESWTIVVLQPAAYVLAPISRFKFIFILVVVLALLLVVALSLFNLRRSLGPIHALNAGIRRIAKKDFSYRVHISSKDEFEELAHGFNDMSSRLGDQFQLLSIQGKIDQATLITRDFSYIARLSITRVLQGFAFDRVAISRVNVDDPDDALIFVGYGSAPDVIASYRRPVDGKHLERFHRDLPWMTVDSAASLSNYLPSACLRDIGPATLFPIFVKDQLYALLSIVGPTDAPPSGETLSLIRQIGDHLAVAWSNVNMVRELRGLTVGSMQALARAVDAKSPWTAGHSARVMRFALGIGRHLALPQERIDQLQQAALLHDIGKIGISSAILDKPGKLTDAEFAAIREHPAIGDRILAPIPVFKELIPMVRGHHERWDGNGYPDGVSGEAIVLEARILSVADVYDAMVSDRPYRRGMGGEKAIAIIKSEAGRQFDPRVVEAFVELMEKKSALAA